MRFQGLVRPEKLNYCQAAATISWHTGQSFAASHCAVGVADEVWGSAGVVDRPCCFGGSVGPAERRED